MKAILHGGPMDGSEIEFQDLSPVIVIPQFRGMAKFVDVTDEIVPVGNFIKNRYALQEVQGDVAIYRFDQLE